MSPDKVKPSVIFIVGPTGVGKSQIAVKLAHRINGEVISADSRYLYKGMDIGTAKPTPEEMTAIPHHLIDVADPDDHWSLAEYLAQIEDKIREVTKRSKTPIIIGGTGQYFRAIVEGWSPPKMEPSKEIREVLQKWNEEIGCQDLHKKLEILDPNAALIIDPKNVRRTIRALEVIFSMGIKFSELRNKTTPKFDFWVIGLSMDRQELYRRIDERIDQMFSKGFVEEVRQLREKGFVIDLPSMSAIGYREVLRFFDGEIGIDQVKVIMKQQTRNLVRRQANWFNEKNTLIHWYDVTSDPLEEIIRDLPEGFSRGVKINLTKPWLKNYDPGVPAILEYPEICIQDFLWIKAQSNPSRTAIISGERKMSYDELHSSAWKFAKNLVGRGLKPGDRVGLLLPNSIEFAVAYYGTLMAGGIVAAMNPSFQLTELAEQVVRTRPRAIVGVSPKLKDLNKKIQIDNLLYVFVSREGHPDGMQKKGTESPEDIIPFEVMMIDFDEHVPMPTIHVDDPAVFQFTGGTTGTPKVAVGTHRNIVANVLQFKAWLVSLRENDEIFLVTIPLYHVYGMVLGLNLGVAMGATMVFTTDPRNIEDLLESIDKYKVTYFPGVPAMFSMINQHIDGLEKRVDLHGIKACISGASPLPEKVRIQFEKLTGGKLVEGYGLSEAPTATHCNPILGAKRAGSIGLPLPDVECRIASINDEEKGMPQGCSGELLIRGPQVMAGYFENPHETALTLKEGWLHTGDVAYMDEDGYFYLKGRIKDLIKVNGLQVWPTEVERVIDQHMGVKECAVAGVLDEEGAERVKVWIVPVGEKNISLQEIQRFCADKIASYKIPTELSYCDAIPKTSVGKVLRRNLKDL